MAYSVSALSALLFATGCGGGNHTTNVSGNTHATLLVTSTNNAQIPIFKFNIQGVSLVASDGTTVSVLTSPQTVELGSINGVARPLVAADIPQGNYTSVQLSYGPSTFVVIDHSSGSSDNDIGGYNINTPGNGAQTTTLTLGTPLTVSGDAMGLLLDLNIPKSTTYVPYFAGTDNFQPDAGQTSFTPVYSLTAVTPSAQPGTLLDGKIEDVHGQVTASSSGVLTITSDSGAPLNFATSSSTIFAGVNAATVPTAGNFVSVDAALQADGSMLATSVQTEGTTQAYNMTGQLMYAGQLMLQNTGREQQGPNLPNGTGFYANNVLYTQATPFVIAWPSGAVPEGLPFTPVLDADSIAIGQNVSTPVDALQTQSNVIPVTNAVTLEPQTINGTVTSVSTVNGQNSYEVTLFSNDFIALFASSQSVVVYATAETHSTTAAALTSGSIARFRGLLFNDGGVLRMVATEIEDGVPAS